MIDLYYNPQFVPGDILSVDGISGIGMVTGTRLCNALEECLEGKQYRFYQLLYFREADGFVYGEFDEMRLKRDARKVNHVNFGKMVYGYRDIADVLHENIKLKMLVGNMEERK